MPTEFPSPDTQYSYAISIQYIQDAAKDIVTTAKLRGGLYQVLADDRNTTLENFAATPRLAEDYVNGFLAAARNAMQMPGVTQPLLTGQQTFTPLESSHPLPELYIAGYTRALTFILAFTHETRLTNETFREKAQVVYTQFLTHEGNK